jgi:hypothetical protein
LSIADLQFASLSAGAGGGAVKTLASSVTSHAAAGGLASTAPPVTGLANYKTGILVCTFSVAGTGGTSLQLIVQGSNDGVTWFDVSSFDVQVPADPTTNQLLAYLSDYSDVGAQNPAKAAPGTIAARAVRPGPWGNQLRLWEVVVGTYAPAPTYSVTGFFEA